MRTETDGLGTRQIDDSQYYGIQTQRAIENFSISRKTIADIPEFVYSIIRIKKAAVMANQPLGLLNQALVREIVTAADELIEAHCLAHFPLVFSMAAEANSAKTA